MMRNVLILGGGTAGIAAALSLTRRGIRTIIVEKGPSIGGLAEELTCKGERVCVKCDVCLATDQAMEVQRKDLVITITEAELDLLERNGGRYRATLCLHPVTIIDSKCTDCGKCAKACPYQAIKRRRVLEGYGHRIDESKCRREENGCRSCLAACPAGAIDLDAEEDSRSVEADAVIVTLGSLPFDPTNDPRLGYEEVPGVISSLDLERSWREGQNIPFERENEGKRIAFIQCVGSRDHHREAPLCSKVCCKYALKLGKMLRSFHPDCELTYFFMDWRPSERGDDLLSWAEAERKVRAIRSRPAEVIETKDGPTVRYASPFDGEVLEETFDLVVLSVGMGPSPSNVTVADLIGVKLNQYGYFFAEGKLARSLGQKGLFFAGACTGPKDLEESAIEGVTVASKVARYLEEG